MNRLTCFTRISSAPMAVIMNPAFFTFVFDSGESEMNLSALRAKRINRIPKIRKIMFVGLIV